MASFAKFLPLLLAAEGGYSTDPDDLGGETYAGISRKYNKDWPGWKLLDEAKKKNPTAYSKTGDWRKNAAFSRNILAKWPGLADAVTARYKAGEWQQVLGDLIPNQSIANQIADHAVNAGSKRAEGLVQWVLRESFGARPFIYHGKDLGTIRDAIETDCQLGPLSLAALALVEPEKFFARYIEVREEFYRYRARRVKNETTRVEQLRKLHYFFRTVLDYNQGNDIPDGHLRSWLNRISAIKFGS